MKFRRFVRLAPLAFVLCAPTFSAPSQASPQSAPNPAVIAITRAGASRPWLVTGALGAPSARDPESIARDTLAHHASWAVPASLVHARTFAFDDGTRIVALEQRIDGVPVLSRGVRVVLEADGRPSLLSTVLEEGRPSSTSPSITAEKATQIARADAKMLAESTTASLLVLPASVGGKPRLCWGVAGSFTALPFRPVALIDAHTGEVVRTWDAAGTLQQAKVYAENPVKTPTLSDVTLTNDTTKEGLENALVTTRNCIDHHTTKTVTFGLGTFTVHVCELDRTVKPNSTGDYTDIAPASDTAEEDSYAELSMFFHTNKAYEFAKSIGLPSAKLPQVTAVANLRMPDGYSTLDLTRMANPSTKLLRFDNAFYSPKDPIFSSLFGVDGDAMWFGQGGVDFGYDGDVVYHEFGHFVVNQTLKLGFGAHADPFGLSYSPGAMNEGIADLFSSFLTNDPKMGEYSAKAFGSLGLKATRELDNKFVFPDAITGEVHQDSEPFTAAVWKVYSKIDASKRTDFHKAFMKALMSSPTGDLSFNEWGTILAKSIAAVDPKLEGDLMTALGDRGMAKDDPRVRTYKDPSLRAVTSYLAIHAPSKRAIGSKGDFAPGIVQIKYDAPAGGESTIHLLANNATRSGVFGSSSGSGAFGGGGTYVPAILAKAGGDPIKFTYDPVAHDAVKADCAMAADKFTFACDITLNVPGTWGETAPVHLMLINSGDADGDYDNVRISADGPPEPPPPDETDNDAGAPPGDQPTGGSSKGGCGCAVPGDTDGSSNVPTLALAALGIALAMRKRR